MIITYGDLPKVSRQHKGKKIVAGFGSFDLLHTGHVAYLRALKEFGDISVAVVKSDDELRKQKDSRRPIIPHSDRARLVDELKCVDYVIVADYKNEEEHVVDPYMETVLAELKPDFFVTSNPRWKPLEVQPTSYKVIVKDRSEIKRGYYASTTDIISSILRRYSVFSLPLVSDLLDLSRKVRSPKQKKRSSSS